LLSLFLTKGDFQKLALYFFGYLSLLILLTPVSLLAQTEVSIPVPVVDERVVLTPSNFPPYSSFDEQHKAQGLAIDLFSIIAERAGINFQYKSVSGRASITQALSQGEGDILLNIGDQKDVARWLDFTSSVVKIPVSIFVRENESSLLSINDLDKRKVVALVVGKNLPRPVLSNALMANLNIEEFNEVVVAFYALISGQVDALIYLDPIIWNVAINLQLSDKIRPLTPPVGEFSFSIGVRKKQQELIQKLELARQSLMDTRQYNAIYDKWFGRESPFWNTKSVFWTMSAIIVLTLLITQWFRSRELEAVNATLQQQIDDATEQLSENNAYLMDLTVTDTLTGINNRRAFENSLTELILRSNRYKEIFSMLIFDIDDFKKLNDQYGHDMGDRVLVELVDRVTKVVRDVDTLCRWGGEEFTILMPQTRQNGALKMAERCRSAVADELFDVVGQVSISLGVTCYMPHDNERKLFKRADDALYEAKSQGKNCVVLNDGRST
jgi:diguanylate cyclase (GGDEF)-like protein